MSNRCPDCSKFVSLEQAEPELEVEVNGNTVAGTVRLVLACADCSTEMKEVNLEFSLEIGHECKLSSEPEFEIECESAEATDRYQDKDQHGKPIKNMRYMTHYHGAEISITVSCGSCGESIELFEAVEEAASGFEEI